ncbi:ArdC-like ssDNA-binding domain-containing protein [Gardnerella pickettii]|uniref:ArdC-like ssDNA-binding domain-containing protein n=1 Tax=Gardnerella pickettii TaxID=2914924 RepID=UPI0039EE38AA
MQDTFNIFDENVTTAQPEAKTVKLSKEEARAKAQEKAESITNRVVNVLHDTFQSVDGVIGLVGSVARFKVINADKHYSMRNILMVIAQMPTVGRVRGFSEWKKADAMVKKGSKGLALVSPKTYKCAYTKSGKIVGAVVRLSDANKARLASGELIVKDEICGGGLAYVFDASQVDGAPVVPDVSISWGVDGEILERLAAATVAGTCNILPTDSRAALSDYAAAIDILLDKTKVCALCVAA